MKKKKFLKQITASCCLFTICLGLAACGNSNQTTASSGAAATVQESTAAGFGSDADESAETSSKDTGSTDENAASLSGEEAADSQESDSELITNDDGSVSQDVFAMDTYMSIKAFGDQASDAVRAATAEIHRLDNLLSTGKKNSEIAQINANGGGTLSTDGEYLVQRSLDLYKETDGAFDIAIYPVMQLWGFPTKNYRVPEQSELDEALKLTDASDIQLDTDNHTISFSKEGMEIDLGGIAKGYTSSRIMDIFKEYNVTSGLVSLGGNVQVYKTKTDGSDWRVAVEDPDNSSAFLGILTTSDKAVITSGGYERYFEKDGKTYHHIIDPKTGYPADSGIHSSTIVSSDGTLADGLSTSLFIMGLDKAEEFWRNHSDEFDFVLETDDGKLYVTSGISGQFTSDRDVEVVQ